MKKISILLLAIALTACHATNKPSSGDSVTFAEFGAYPLDAVEDCEPVYISTEDLTSYQVGDTIEVNQHGFIPAELPLRDAETKQEIKPADWHWVVLSYKDKVTKRFSRDEAESNQ